MIPFVKMHGCGNDFVVVRQYDLDALGLDEERLATVVRRVCDRHFGIGADGLLAYAAGRETDYVRMSYWNRDGGRAEMCGNGARCVVRLAFERGETTSPLRLATDSGVLDASIELENGAHVIEIRMGRVRWDPESVGLEHDTALVDAPLDVGGAALRVNALSVGNPHAVVFLPSVAALERVALDVIGAALSAQPLFREGANVSFAALDADDLRVRVWERGSGATLACGTAACAVVAAAVRLGHIDTRRARVRLPGGSVEVRIDANEHAWLRGPAVRVAEGHIDDSLLTLS